MKHKLTTAILEKALVDETLVLHYQPIVSLVTGKICGAESLIRWKQPDGSLMYPDSFIPFAERTGFISEITKAMLSRVVKDLATVNLSALTLEMVNG